MSTFLICVLNNSTKPFTQEKFKMDNKKFEQLIDLIINENEEQARELFHEIVVEKSREIYESIMDEEMMEAKHDEDKDKEEVEESAEDSEDAIEEAVHDDMGEGEMVGEVGDLLDEINVEEAGGMTEEEEDLEVIDLDASDAAPGEGGGLAAIEDKIDDLDAKLEALMAEFTGDDADMGDDSGEEEGEEEVEVDSEEEEAMMEAVALKKVPGLYNSKIGGDNGANTKSPALTKPKVETAGVKPVKFSGDSEAVPTSPKKPSNAYSKGEKDVEGASNWKNVPGKDNFKEKGESAPKPVTSQASGVNNKSVVAKS